MHSVDLTKRDGHGLTLYSTRPIRLHDAALRPTHERVHPSAHLRWHPLRGDCVANAAFRRNFPFSPPAYNQIDVGSAMPDPSELPTGDYDVAVFESRARIDARMSALDASPEETAKALRALALHLDERS